MKTMKWIALLLAGSFFLGGCGGGRLPKGVTVNGIPVGGMRQEEAAALLRGNMERSPLVIHAPQGDVTADLDYADDLDEILKGAKRGGEYRADVRREWIFAERELEEICRRNTKAGTDAQLSFDGNGFVYTPETDGIVCDYHVLLADVWKALREGGTEVCLTTKRRPPEVTVEKLKERTRELSAFSTKFDASNGPRSRNIALAARRISGTVLESGEEFSFNRVVGKRTEENGFETANVILDGEFVPGVGGGVCQASTTLFGAALRAGMEVTESRPHSLSVGYVPPSEDAMVSEFSDLKFVNPYPFPVYLLGNAEGGKVGFTFYGAPDGRRYEVESRVLFRLDPPPAKVIEGEQNRVVRAEKAGIASESYLLVYEGEKLLSRTLIRRDTYACVQGIEERAPMSETPEQILEEEGKTDVGGEASLFPSGKDVSGEICGI